MSKVHIGRDGKPATCSAHLRPCPLGGTHYSSMREAIDAVIAEQNRRQLSGNKLLEWTIAGQRQFGLTETEAQDFARRAVEATFEERQPTGKPEELYIYLETLAKEVSQTPARVIRTFEDLPTELTSPLAMRVPDEFVMQYLHKRGGYYAAFQEARSAREALGQRKLVTMDMAGRLFTDLHIHGDMERAIREAYKAAQEVRLTEEVAAGVLARFTNPLNASLYADELAPLLRPHLTNLEPNEWGIRPTVNVTAAMADLPTRGVIERFIADKERTGWVVGSNGQ